MKCCGYPAPPRTSPGQKQHHSGDQAPYHGILKAGLKDSLTAADFRKKSVNDLNR